MPIDLVSSTVTQKAITYAVAQVGKPYRWGGTGPDSFDCSGLLWRAFKEAGGNPGGRWTTYTMLAGMAKVSATNPQPGDFLFPSTGHVVMCIGGGKIVEAPRTGVPVRIKPLSSRKWLWARRYGAPGAGSNSPEDVYGPGAQNASLFDGLPLVQNLTTFADNVTDKHMWMRLAIGAFGAWLLWMSILKLAMSGNAGKVVKSTQGVVKGTAAKVGKVTNAGTA